MRRYLLPTAAAVAVVGLLVSPVQALRIALPPQPGQVALTTPVIVTGKVTSIEKETVEVLQPWAGAKEKQTYKVAVVKIDKALAGAENLTHIKIGFIPPAKVDPNAPKPVPPVGPGGPAALAILPVRPGFQQPELKEGQEAMFFLAKHPKADFYLIANNVNPVDIKTDDGKKQLEEVTKTLAVVADPMKGLKSDKAEVRLDTATKLIQKYRGSYPPFGGETEQVAIDKEESKLILKALAEAEWKQPVFRPGNPAPAGPNAMGAFYQLNLQDGKDGWKQPKFPVVPVGQPQPDYNAMVKDAFVKWLDADGKDYVVKKIVPKKTDK